jgi:hypothetical protein
MCENWCCTYEKIILAHNMRFQSISSLPHVTHSSVPFSRPCLTSFVPFLYYFSQSRSSVLCLCSLSPVFSPLSHSSVPCLPTSVPCRSTVPVSPFLWLYSMPLGLSFAPLFPVLCSSISCPLSTCLSYLQECKFLFILHTVHPTTFRGAEEMKQRTIFNSFVPISCSSPHFFSSGSASHEIVPTYAHLLSQLQWK